MVDRYDLSGEYDLVMTKMEDGDYVLYDNYEALEAKLARLVGECERVLKDMPLYGYNLEPREMLRQAVDAAKVTP